MLGAKGCHSTIPQGSSKTHVLAVFCCGQSLTKQTAKKRLKAVLRVLCLVLNLEVRGQYKELFTVETLGRRDDHSALLWIVSACELIKVRVENLGFVTAQQLLEPNPCSIFDLSPHGYTFGP